MVQCSESRAVNVPSECPACPIPHIVTLAGSRASLLIPGCWVTAPDSEEGGGVRWLVRLESNDHDAADELDVA